MPPGLLARPVAGRILAQGDGRDFLVNNASNRWRAPTAPLRITETAWFQRKHDSHEIRPEIWKRAAVKSPANCAACHPGAGKGDFEEDRIRIPR